MEHEGERLDRRIWLLASVTSLGLLMALIDTTAVIVALDTLARRFHTNLLAVQWVSTGYLLSLSFVIPLTRWLVGRFGTKLVWMGAASVFLLGSGLAGAAWSMSALTVFRVIQGFGGGLLQPVGQSVLARAAGPRRMGRVMSISALPLLVGPIIGPVIGGLLVQEASWRWIFYVNLPIGAIALLLAWRLLPSDSDRHPMPLDVRGLLMLSPGVALLAYGLSAAGTSGFGAARTLGCIVGGVVLIAVFVPHARRLGRRALIDVGLFAKRGFTAAVAVNLLFQMGNYGAVLIMPLYYQLVRGEGALQAGLVLTPQAVGAGLAMPFAGRLTDRLGPRRLIPIGVVLLLVGTYAFTQVGTDTSFTLLAVAQLVRGVGLGFTVLPANAAGFASLSKDEIPGASTAISTIQRLGSSFGVALIAVLLDLQLHSVVPAGHGGALSSLADMSIRSRARLAGPLASSFGHAFWLAFALTAVCVVPVLMMRSGRPTAVPEFEVVASGPAPP
jgi:EmrB/QacA subfamily drug resistance transporter